ncbi:MAG: type IV pilus modification protein PilV [Nitrosomonas sp.]|uniref:type IV pilus modification protein PilV n=1 Tax=Nitrosomonas sp. TaxID=42353 RepID=UPI0025EB9FC5|nr:type IV pilus modification protein PilV [Nitrosomonas sp.]MBY0474367.1 type IV pilus modification protein PilV [Nitrosomonas sp.]
MRINRVFSIKKKIQNNGFSLIEVLITLLIVSFGLLGMAALVVSGARSNNVAYYRSVASKQTEDIADRMRANIAGVVAGAYDALSANIPSSADCVANTCSPTQIATFDHALWNTANARLLPGGVGIVNGNLAAGYSITLMWTEKEMADDPNPSPNCPGGTANTQCFVTRFAP